MENTITVSSRTVRAMTRACEEFYKDPANEAKFQAWLAEKRAREALEAANPPKEPKETTAQFIERMSVRYHKYDPRGAK
ncbi:MAG: hypothetical protein IJX76_02485 [Clostridia bacterium]|nr:hypothetical protein [Clostridia bacterium]